MDLLRMPLEQLQMFVVVIARIGAIFITAPVFNNRQVPLMVKAGLTFMTVMLIYGLIDRRGLLMPANLWGFSALIGREFLVGAIIGLTATFIFNGIQASGELVGPQMGLNLDELFDPITGIEEGQGSLPGQMYLLLGSLLFLQLDMHHWLLQVFCSSYDIVPLAGVRVGEPFLHKILAVGGEIFAIAIKLSAPLFILLLMLTLVMGIISKLIPDIEIMLLMMPVRIGVGVVVLALSLPFCAQMCKKLFVQMETDVTTVLRLLGNG
ncbi:MAG: flagellar biosynthetic protein FliR [Candidatus Omnitrophica bacterium]|nr:flagellar biosynthetic protein FliR [Candidatus Omnitrophota bacterium]